MEDHRCSLASGKALGGSSVLDSMLYTRGNQKDYDIWADLGNDGWCYSDVLPYFLKSENVHLHHFDNKHHRQGGPVQVEEPQFHSHLLETFLEAAKLTGLKRLDYNGKEQMGMGTAQVTTKNGARNSMAEAYLAPSSKRKNLHVSRLSHVIEIIINPHTKEASGVKYLHDGKLFIAKAVKEIILSAGVYNSPQLLMLSGVGPKELLEKNHIPIVKELPVGEHYKDHVAFVGLNFVTEHKKEEHNHHDELVQWLKDGKGPLSSPGIEGVAFLKTDQSKDNTDYPDVQLHFSARPEEMAHLPIKNEVIEKLMKPLEEKSTFSISVMPTHPISSGHVQLKSKDPLNWPLINNQQFSDPDDHDLNTMIAGIKKAITIGLAEPFEKLGVKLHPVPIPGCEQHKFESDPYWKCAIKHLSIALGHGTGTCRMGPSTDKKSVVDNKLKVYGVHKLRVADSSIIPVSITGHINAANIMIGEKAADLVKEEWK